MFTAHESKSSRLCRQNISGNWSLFIHTQLSCARSDRRGNIGPSRGVVELLELVVNLIFYSLILPQGICAGFYYPYLPHPSPLPLVTKGALRTPEISPHPVLPGTDASMGTKITFATKGGHPCSVQVQVRYYYKYSDTRVDLWTRFWRGGNEVYRPNAHAVAYMLKEKKFREHFRDTN